MLHIILLQKSFKVIAFYKVKKHVPARSLWLSKVFTELVISHEKHCLTIHCSFLNRNGPGQYRSSADNPEKQVCYFNKAMMMFFIIHL